MSNSESTHAAAPTEDSPTSLADERPPRVDIPIETKLEMGTAAAEEAFKLLGVEVESIEGVIKDEQISIKVGKITKPEGLVLEGRVFESLQFILNKSVNKHASKRSRLRIEAEGFLARRVDRVDKAAHALARKVHQLRRPLTLGPLADADRKQFVSQLQRAGGVAVQAQENSHGTRLVISPSGGRKRRGRR